MSSRHWIPLLIVCIVHLIWGVQLRAQDAHYWTLQFGPRPSMLGGAVVGSVNDISGTYYNPGGLSLADDLGFALTANVFERSSVKLEDDGGETVDLGTNRSGLRPQMLAGTFSRHLFGAGILAYSAIARMQGSHDLKGVSELSGEELPDEIGLDDLVELGQVEGDFGDFWLGLTFSHALGSKIGLGATWHGALRSQQKQRQSIVQGIDTGGSGTQKVVLRSAEYSAFRTLAKIGAFAESGRLSGGITLTTPSLHIAGTGDLALNLGEFGSDTTRLASSTQTGLPAEFRSPLSVGAGLAFRFPNGRIHGSVEWFDEVGPYIVMQGEPFNAQEPESEVVSIDAVQALDEVLNWGLALEYTFAPRLTGYLSYYTDDSGLTDGIERADLSGLPIDIRTVNLGADFSVGKTRLTVAGGYGWGRHADQRIKEVLIDLDPEFEPIIVYQSLRFLFGIELGFN